jgi:hypothetical protein
MAEAPAPTVDSAMYYLWLGGLSAVCGLVILKSRQDSKVVTTGVCGTTLTRPPKERVGVRLGDHVGGGWVGWLSTVFGAVVASSALTPTPLVPPLHPHPPPHAADFKKFQKNFLAVYLVMVMSDWMQVRGTRAALWQCTVACFGNGFVAIVGGAQGVAGFKWKPLPQPAHALCNRVCWASLGCVIGVGVGFLGTAPFSSGGGVL